MKKEETHNLISHIKLEKKENYKDDEQVGTSYIYLDDTLIKEEPIYAKKTKKKQETIFDKITQEDLIVAFFPCIHFCDAKTMQFKGVSLFQKKWTLERIMKENIEASKIRQYFFEILLKMVYVCAKNRMRLVIENPWNDSGETYLQRNFIAPAIIDKDRSARGDWFVKPTAYWFINCRPTQGFTEQRNKEVKIVYKQQEKHWEKGKCSETRSLISSDYARNWICDFILGKYQEDISGPTLFDLEEYIK